METRIVIKSNSHGNGAEVFRHGESFNKIALTKDANAVIEREKQGYDWFGVDTKLQTTDTGIKYLIIPRFRGKTFPQYNGISGNEMWIMKLIDFYNNKWTKDKFAIHGDLALCNVIFGGEGRVHIVDWEHFHYADKRYYGFDILNMLFIHLQYEYRWLDWGVNWVPIVKERHQMFFADCFLKLKETPFLRRPFRNAHQYINKYMDRNKFKLGRLKLRTLESLDILCGVMA